MSRTRRKLPFILFWSSTYSAWRKWPIHYFRHPKTLSTKKQEQAAVQALWDEGFNPPPRLSARSNSNNQNIPDAYMDLSISARTELDYNNYQLSKVKDLKWP